MKKYISPEMIMVQIDTQEVIADSNRTFGFENPTSPTGSFDDPDQIAAPTYRNSLWND